MEEESELNREGRVPSVATERSFSLPRPHRMSSCLPPTHHQTDETPLDVMRYFMKFISLDVQFIILSIDVYFWRLFRSKLQRHLTWQSDIIFMVFDVSSRFLTKSLSIFFSLGRTNFHHTITFPHGSRSTVFLLPVTLDAVASDGKDQESVPDWRSDILCDAVIPVSHQRRGSGSLSHVRPLWPHSLHWHRARPRLIPYRLASTSRYGHPHISHWGGRETRGLPWQSRDLCDPRNAVD